MATTPEKIVNESRTFSFAMGATPPEGVTTPAALVPGAISVVGALSSKTNAPLGLRVHRGPLEFSLSGFGNGTCQGASTLPPNPTITPSAEKVRADGDPVVREGDEETEVKVTGVDTVSLSPCSFYVNVKIQGAGQSKAKAK